jgi:thiamine pyrophosphate-dependent acetolactate synthase large subunit-like protein
MEQLHEKVQKVASLLKNSSYAVILTGSGVSDKEEDANFRSPGQRHVDNA